MGGWSPVLGEDYSSLIRYRYTKGVLPKQQQQQGRVLYVVIGGRTPDSYVGGCGGDEFSQYLTHLFATY